MRITESQLRDFISETLANEYEWEPGSKESFLLHKDGMEKSDKDNVEHYLKSMNMMESFIYRPNPDYIFERSYVTGVLGIPLPLNEALPYSRELEDRIIKEQLLLEGFFSDFRKLGKDTKSLALSLRYMMEDPGRIKTFVQSAYNTVIKEPLEKILDFIKRMLSLVPDVFKNFDMPGKVKGAWDSVKGFLQKIGKWLKEQWEKIKAMDGWKQAIAVMAFGTGIAYLWSEKKMGDIVNAATKAFDGLKTAGEKGGKALADIMKKLGKNSSKVLALKKESVVSTMPLSMLLYDDNIDSISALFEEEEPKPTTADKVEKADQATDNAALVSSLSDKLTDGDFDVIKQVTAEIMSKLQPIIDVVKEKVMDLFKDIAKSLGADALIGLASGGIGTFLSYIKKAFGGVKLFSTLFGDSMANFVDKIENPKEEAEEAEKGEDDPTDEGTKKEETKSEALIRRLVRETLLYEGVEFRELESPLTYSRARNVKRLALCDTSVEEPNTRPDGKPTRDAYFNPEQEWEHYGKSGRRLKKPRKGQMIPGVSDACVIGFLDFHKYGDNGWYIDYMKTRGDKGGQGTASKLVDEFFQRYVDPDGGYVHFGKMMQPQVGHLKDKMAEKYPNATVIGAKNF